VIITPQFYKRHSYEKKLSGNQWKIRWYQEWSRIRTEFVHLKAEAINPLVICAADIQSYDFH